MKSYKIITVCLLSAAMTAAMPSYAWAEADITVFSDGQEELMDEEDIGDTTISATETDEGFSAGTESDSYGLKLDEDTITFSDADEDETWSRGIYFTITGQKDITVTVDASELKHFDFLDEEELNVIDPEQIVLKNLKPGQKKSLSIRPKQEYGVYDEVFYLCTDNGNRYPIHVKMDREKQNDTEHLQITAEKKDFGSRIWKYSTPPEPLSMEVKNVSQEDLTLNMSKTNSEYEVSIPSTKTLKAGQTITINVQPKVGLSVGFHDLGIKITAENSAGERFSNYVNYAFMVSDQLFSGVVPSELQTIKTVNGVPKTLAGLELPTLIRVYGVEKKSTFNAEVNWDVEHCAYQADSKKAQKFEVTGELKFDDPEINRDHLDTTVKISVEVAEYKGLNAPVLGNAGATGNGVYVTVSGLSSRAQGYQCVLVSSKKNLAKGKFAAEGKYEDVKKNTCITLDYVQKGSYYLYCRGYKKNAKGELEYGDWSDAQKVKVTEKTPTAPKIKKVEVKGCEVRITLDKPVKNGQFQVVAAKKKNGNEPVKAEAAQGYAGDSNVLYLTVPWKKGTYYIGVQSSYKPYKTYGYCGPFSRWSDLVKVTIKEAKIFEAPSIKKTSVFGKNVTVKFKNPDGLTGSKWVLANRVITNGSGGYQEVKSPAYTQYTQNSGTITFKNVKPGTYYLAGQGYKKYYNKIYTDFSQIRKVVVK